MFKKGSVIFRDVGLRSVLPREVAQTNRMLKYELVEPGSHTETSTADALAEPVQQSKTQAEKDKKRRAKAKVVVEHIDIIRDDFWESRPWILSNKPGKVPKTA